ncbi:MAG: methyltransferase domain-containing protein [Acetobacteraceae bacterium]
MDQVVDPTKRRVGIEFRKCIARWQRDGLLARFLSGEHILDIGFKGGDPEAVPVTPSAIGIGLDYPGYDGRTLPFEDESQDAIFASAVLEHISDYKQALREWYRVTKIGGHIIIFVPNRYLYEQRPDLPGRWNGDHRRFYTPAALLRELEEALPVNGFRIRHLLDADEGFDYGAPMGSWPRGVYQIEAVAERIAIPSYTPHMVYPPHVQNLIAQYDRMIFDFIRSVAAGTSTQEGFMTIMGKPRYFTPWHRLEEQFIYNPPPDRGLSREQLRTIVQPILDLLDVDVAAYIKTYRDLAKHPNPAVHWRRHGYYEGRTGSVFEVESGSMPEAAEKPAA